jgi:hypothetical protein
MSKWMTRDEDYERDLPSDPTDPSDALYWRAHNARMARWLGSLPCDFATRKEVPDSEISS